MNHKKICIVIVNFNNSQLSIDCFNSVQNQFDVAEITFIVVDNNSIDSEKKLLYDFEQCHERFEVIYLTENIGYFPAMSKGQKYAFEKSSYDYMIIANNDLIFAQDFIVTLCSLNEPDEVMVISPDIITIEGIHQNPHFVNRISRFRKFLYNFYYSNWYMSIFLLFFLRLCNVRRHDRNKPGYDKEQFIYIGFGACFILTKSFMNIIGIVDTRSFLMGEEQLLAQQVKNAKGKIKYIPRLKVNHIDSATFKKLPTRFAFENEKKAYKLYKNNI